MARVAAHRVGLIVLGVLGAFAPTASAQTSGGSWVLEKGQGVKSVKNGSASLMLDNKQMSGSTGCNTYKATLTDRPDKRVAISDVALTRKLCAPQLNDNERAIVQAFGKTEFVEEAAGRLTFFSATREPLLVWRPATQERAVRAGMVPPSAGRQIRQEDHATKAKSSRKQRSARATKASRQHMVHRHHKRGPRAYQVRRCRCICGWWG